MSYMSRGGRPFENASKSAHSHVISDPSVKAFLRACVLPKTETGTHLDSDHLAMVDAARGNPVEHVIALDGGYQEVPVKREYPSASIAFLQFGALIFDLKDLLRIGAEPFIAPEDIATLNQIERFKLTIPVRNVVLAGGVTMTDSIRRTIHGFCETQPSDPCFNSTLAWLIFRQFKGTPVTWDLASCPSCRHGHVELSFPEMSSDHTFVCPHCGHTIYLTDVFRFHEIIDDDLGAGGILAYLTNSLEQLTLAYVIRVVLDTKPSMLNEILFVRDGPLAFFGQTANLHAPFRNLVRHLLDHYDLCLVGLEKSGPFVDHANAISKVLLPGQALVLSSDYIYANVLPRSSAAAGSYGSNTYYGTKIIYKSPGGGMYVATLPTWEYLADPLPGQIPNLNTILTNINALKCDMYDSALLPIALANHLVSLANHPSAVLLEKFAREVIVR